MMHFVKMHGLGNDYVYMDGFSTTLPNGDAALKRLAVAVSDRHRGIGSDGLILILPSSVADIRMRMAVKRKCAATAYAALDAMP